MLGSIADKIFQFTKITSSAIAKAAGENKGILYSVAGMGSVDFSGKDPVIRTDDDRTESDDSAECFGQLGFLARPLPPKSNAYAEAICYRDGDEFVPVACRDTRLKMQGNGPNEGTVAMVGYGGGFLSMDPVMNGDDAEATVQVLYCPFDFNSSGVAQKAHSITLDPSSGNESISIIHSDGMAITMFNDEVVIKNRTGTASITLDEGGITMTGQINLAGSVVIGNPNTAVPLVAGTASPPCSTLFLSP